MSLIKCPECGREISDQATACPQCGFPLSSAPPAPVMDRTEAPEPKKKSHGALIGFLISAVVCVVLIIMAVRAFNGPPMSARAVSLGKDAVSVADSYLDGSISRSAAASRIDDIYDSLGLIEDSDYSVASKTRLLTVHVLSLHSDILFDDGSASDYSDILESRNKVADDLGIRNRK